MPEVLLYEIGQAAPGIAPPWPCLIRFLVPGAAHLRSWFVFAQQLGVGNLVGKINKSHCISWNVDCF